MIRLFLDAQTRAFKGQAPIGAVTRLEELSQDSVELQVSEADWQQIYYPAWLAAHQSGRDLVVQEDGSFTAAQHVPTLAEQQATARKGALKAFAHNPAPAAADRDAALRALIQHLGLDI